MSFLLDTNVVSESIKPNPDPGVVAWLTGADEDQIFLSVATVAEVCFGIEKLPKGKRKRQLEDWLTDQLLPRFAGRVVPVDLDIAKAWGEISARREKQGRPIEAMDALIAATAHVHGLKLVTRNESDFASAASEIVNPWKTSSR